MYTENLKMGSSGAQTLKEKANRYFNFILPYVIALPGLFLLLNRYTYFGIVSITFPFFLGILLIFYYGRVTKYHFELIKFLLVIYVYFIASYFISNQDPSSFFSYKFLRYDGNFFFSYLPFFFLAAPLFDYKKIADIFFKFLFISFSLFSSIGIMEFITGNNFLTVVDDPNYGRLFLGLNNSHNATGSIYAVVCIFALVFLLAEKRFQVKFIYLIVFLLCLAGLFLTKSRGSFVAFIAGAVFVIIVNSKTIIRFIKIAGFFIVVTVPFLLMFDNYKRLFKLFDFNDINILVRFDLWQKAIDIFKLSPVFGIGFGRFNDVSPFRVYQEATGYKGVFAFYNEQYVVFSSAHAHNSYLNFLAETGLFGLCLVLFFWAACFVYLWRGYKSSTDGFENTAFLAGLGQIIVLLTLSMSEHYLSAPTVMLCISMLTSLLVGMCWKNNYQIKGFL